MTAEGLLRAFSIGLAFALVLAVALASGFSADVGNSGTSDAYPFLPFEALAFAAFVAVVVCLSGTWPSMLRSAVLGTLLLPPVMVAHSLILIARDPADFPSSLPGQIAVSLILVTASMGGGVLVGGFVGAATSAVVQCLMYLRNVLIGVRPSGR